METPRILARIIGPLMIVTAAAVLLHLQTYPRLIEEFGKSAGLCYLTGFMALALGLLILQFHHKWELRWPVLITIYGWIALIKGAALMVAPAEMLNLSHPLTASTLPLVVSSSISLLIGAFLTFKGYGKG